LHWISPEEIGSQGASKWRVSSTQYRQAFDHAAVLFHSTSWR
jgi:hypothetical protein